MIVLINCEITVTIDTRIIMMTKTLTVLIDIDNSKIIEERNRIRNDTKNMNKNT